MTKLKNIHEKTNEGRPEISSDRPSILSETKFAQQGCYATKLRGDRFKKTERAVFFIKKPLSRVR